MPDGRRATMDVVTPPTVRSTLLGDALQLLMFSVAFASTSKFGSVPDGAGTSYDGTRTLQWGAGLAAHPSTHVGELTTEPVALHVTSLSP